MWRCQSRVLVFGGFSFFSFTIIVIFLLLFSFAQRFQRSREFSREDCLVATPGRDGANASESTSCTPRHTPGRAATPRRTPRSAATPGRTPASKGRKTPEASVRGVKTGGGRRQLVRMAALRSPFASPNTQNQRMYVPKQAAFNPSPLLSVGFVSWSWVF